MSFLPSFDSASTLQHKKKISTAVFSGSLPVYTLFRELSVNPDNKNIPLSNNLFPVNPYYEKDRQRTNQYRTPVFYSGYMLKLGLKYDLELIINPGVIPFVVDFIPYTEMIFDIGIKKQFLRKDTSNISLSYNSGIRHSVYYYGHPITGSFILTNSIAVFFGKEFKSETKQGLYRVSSFNTIPSFEFNYNAFVNVIHLNSGFEQNFTLTAANRAVITVGYFINAGFMTYHYETYYNSEDNKTYYGIPDKKIFSVEAGLLFGIGKKHRDFSKKRL